MFGIQDSGECWSGADGAIHYSKHGKSESCFKGDFSACENISDHIKNTSPCAGGKATNYVYKIVHVQDTDEKMAAR